MLAGHQAYEGRIVFRYAGQEVYIGDVVEWEGGQTTRVRAFIEADTREAEALLGVREAAGVLLENGVALPRYGAGWEKLRLVARAAETDRSSLGCACY